MSECCDRICQVHPQWIVWIVWIVCLKIEESCKEKLHWWCHLVKFTLASPSPVLLATTPPNERGPLEADLDRHARLTILYMLLIKRGPKY